MLPWVAPDIEHVVEYAGASKKFSTRPKTHPSSAQGSNFWRLAYWGFRLSDCGQNGNIQQMKRLVYAPLLCTPNQLGTSGGAPQDLELIQSRAYSHQLLPAIPWRQKKRKNTLFCLNFCLIPMASLGKPASHNTAAATYYTKFVLQTQSASQLKFVIL